MNLCIHGHFYQPPREDPISNYIPDEIGAEPFHNWNERILNECYAPNARAGNFGRISFNVGPTLFRWMAEFAPDVTSMIIEQEKANFERYGTGNGMAQGYNHVILPLATYQDKVTQIRWGIGDFIFRFGHTPEGFWLPETAVDNKTLQVLSDQGIKFTILAPWQVTASQDELGPYRVDLGENHEPIIAFTYDRELSTRISFIPEATRNGDAFLAEIVRTHNHNPDRLTTMASDGELYGHHQHFHDYFLTYLLTEGAAKYGVDWTYPGRWIKEHDIPHTASLNERTSWSCLHGVTRWEDECGCAPGADWKKPLRLAFNQIAEWVDQIFLDVTSTLFPDPWELRHRYIDVLTGKMTTEALCLELANGSWQPGQIRRVETLLHAQYERQRMFTSCGFYFDEFHRIEPQNNIAYAANAVWLAQSATGLDISPAILDLLRQVKSKKTGLRGDVVFSQTLMRTREEKLA